ncbi:TPA: pilin [Clostridioides difficile]|nr:pilin [Clostridioides difficile]HBF6775755.1 pilin [Clostridioides difficile]HBY3545539.1 pilin [Clostridioides difficile]
MENKKMFTLVKLLIIIAIISIFMVIVPQVLFENMENSKIYKLESDVSAIKSASISYYIDKSKLTYENTVTWQKKDGKIIVNSGFKDNPIKQKIENLDMPYNGSYILMSSEDHKKYLVLLIAPDGEISRNGIKKLKNDYKNSIDIEYLQGKINMCITLLNNESKS